ncbi:hypothetical protein P153DRAFT_362785 [Dothidotthia symphoricarpi CBS 119687]|uniref:Transcription elongation factor Eaf N-terminal domain-containing protein n=1 Tax=Dothidotthia symphoricarpi CBS 119687 TaxID=1392245 RepID=A0A6A6API9_9PLEO|nr:uncharacterized protein P153DRAFT_362785 [Dothidotthia symphoricarpi CBS 119687]KAF2133710.1 hypothetical protein P153DRAFT_362785 [Dothidotthia symphoricarpi CBS 119687]
MASPMIEGRVEPHKKAHFNLHISDRIAKNDMSSESYSSVKYNHKPAQTSDTRSTTLTASSANAYNLKLEDGDSDMFKFTGQRTTSKKSYLLLFDPATQKATLEPLTNAYTFNLASRNNKDISSQHPKIYPKKLKDDAHTKPEADEDLFGDTANNDENDEPDADNPYDFRHFLPKEQEKRGDESEYGMAYSPDPRSVVNTPQVSASTTTTTTTTKPRPEPAPKKRKTAPAANPMVSKPPRKPAAAPLVRIERPAPDRAPDAAPPKAAKIKSTELVHSSDESDAASPDDQDAEGESDDDVDADADADADDDEDDDDGGLQIEVPDARPPRPRQNLNTTQQQHQHLRSPSNGPISLASATNSPNAHAFSSRRAHDEEEIDFGDLGGEDAEGEDDDEEGDEGEGEGDGDVEPMDIGPPVHRRSTGGVVVEEEGDEDDPLYKEMMEGLAGGDSSEESEEE